MDDGATLSVPWSVTPARGARSGAARADARRLPATGRGAS